MIAQIFHLYISYILIDFFYTTVNQILNPSKVINNYRIKYNLLMVNC